MHSCWQHHHKVAEMFVVTKKSWINEKPSRHIERATALQLRRQPRVLWGEIGPEGRGVQRSLLSGMQSWATREMASPYHPTVLFCHTSNTRWTSSCQKTLSACFLNKRTGCGRYCFRALYFHVRRGCKVVGTQNSYVLQKCPETSNVTLSAER